LEGQGARLLQAVPQHDILDRRLIAKAKGALENGTPVTVEAAIKNTDRTAGAMLSGQVAKRYGHAGLPDDTITVKLKGTAGQSFGAWLAHGVTFELEGEATTMSARAFPAAS
jgi:glutamate synthase (NADPH) large chain